jgi:hypothetical protein
LIVFYFFIGVLRIWFDPLANGGIFIGVENRFI